MEHPVNLSLFDGTYEDLCQEVNSVSNLVVLVFFANWCPSCQNFAKTLVSLASEHQNVTFLYANTDESPDLISHYAISSIPHIKFLKSTPENQIQELSSITGIDVHQITKKIHQYSV